MEILNYKETERISIKQYCPSRRVPLDAREILLEKVRKEDEINHANDTVEVELPKYEKVKVKHPQWVKNWVRGTLGQLMP